MSAALTVVNNFTGTMVSGDTVTGKQGVNSSEFGEGYDLTLTGLSTIIQNALATASVVKVYDDDTHVPADPIYWHFWADGNLYIQFVGLTTNFVLPLHAYVPLVLYGHTLLAAANTTDITGGAEPSLEDIDHVNLGNYSGASVSYKVSVFY